MPSVSTLRWSLKVGHSTGLSSGKSREPQVLKKARKSTVVGCGGMGTPKYAPGRTAVLISTSQTRLHGDASQHPKGHRPNNHQRNHGPFKRPSVPRQAVQQPPARATTREAHVSPPPKLTPKVTRNAIDNIFNALGVSDEDTAGRIAVSLFVSFFTIIIASLVGAVIVANHANQGPATPSEDNVEIPDWSVASYQPDPIVRSRPVIKLVAGYDPHGEDRDCADFDTQADAQRFFIAAGGPEKDPHQIEGDKDGIACESLLLDKRYQSR